MRIAAQVMVTYLMLLLLSVLWRYVGPVGVAPDLVALAAVYLGLTARFRLAPSMAGAVVMGLVADLLLGTPRGSMAVVAGVVCLAGHFVQGRLLVRGWLFTAVFSALIAMLAGGTGLFIRAMVVPNGYGFDGTGLGRLLTTAALTGVCGPLVFRVFRIVDSRLARTQRERDMALEGLIP